MATKLTDDQIRDAAKRHIRTCSQWQPVTTTKLAQAVGVTSVRVKRALEADERFRAVEDRDRGITRWHLWSWPAEAAGGE